MTSAIIQIKAFENLKSFGIKQQNRLLQYKVKKPVHYVAKFSCLILTTMAWRPWIDQQLHNDLFPEIRKQNCTVADTEDHTSELELIDSESWYIVLLFENKVSFKRQL